MDNILVGPLLGFEGTCDEGEWYSFCFLSGAHVKLAELRIKGMSVLPFECIAETATGLFWRASFCPGFVEEARQLEYEIFCDGQKSGNGKKSEWSFHILGRGEQPKFAYASCNGFGHAEAAIKTRDHHVLWQKMVKENQRAPYAMLLMGGDQLYADTLWGELGLPKINHWPQLPESEKEKYQLTPELESRIDAFYEKLYIESWQDESMSEIMACVPSVMMWDDHDIYDGWGSFPDELLHHPIYDALYRVAARYFELFQLRSLKNRSMIRKKGDHYSCVLQYRNFHIISLDQRSGRTIDTIMTEKHWDDLDECLAGIPQFDHVLVMIAVPLVYRSFRFVEWVYDKTHVIEEMEDDVHDHWSAIRHRDERGRMVMTMVEIARKSAGKVAILSGDVHIGGIGMIYDYKGDNRILQIISSGIMNQPPTLLQWLLIKLCTTDDRLYFNNGEITSKLRKARGALSYIRDRNYATVKLLKNDKLRVRWHCSKRQAPRYIF